MYAALFTAKLPSLFTSSELQYLYLEQFTTGVIVGSLATSIALLLLLFSHIITILICTSNITVTYVIMSIFIFTVTHTYTQWWAFLGFNMCKIRRPRDSVPGVAAAVGAVAAVGACGDVAAVGAAAAGAAAAGAAAAVGAAAAAHIPLNKTMSWILELAIRLVTAKRKTCKRRK